MKLTFHKNDLIWRLDDKNIFQKLHIAIRHACLLTGYWGRSQRRAVQLGLSASPYLSVCLSRAIELILILFNIEDLPWNLEKYYNCDWKGTTVTDCSHEHQYAFQIPSQAKFVERFQYSLCALHTSPTNRPHRDNEPGLSQQATVVTP